MRDLMNLWQFSKGKQKATVNGREIKDARLPSSELQLANQQFLESWKVIYLLKKHANCKI
jgi:hypothetical protein